MSSRKASSRPSWHLLISETSGESGILFSPWLLRLDAATTDIITTFAPSMTRTFDGGRPYLVPGIAILGTFAEPRSIPGMQLERGRMRPGNEKGRDSRRGPFRRVR